MGLNDAERKQLPHPAFRFAIDFREVTAGGEGGAVKLCGASFTECTGLEATMEPKVIKEGGRNYGPVQRAGPVTFGTVILKRGMTSARDLWRWFELVNTSGKSAYRLSAAITVFDLSGEALFTWKLEKALPVKFKAADLNAKATDVGVEELHLVHEGLTLAPSPERARL